MKRFIIILILLLMIKVISAQEIKVSIMSDNAPVEYAYLFINNDYYASSDSTGFVCINQSDISAGDTISVRYIGMDGAAVAYSPDNYGPEGITIILNPNTGLEEIVVMGEDLSIRILKRYVKDRYSLSLFLEYRANYSIQQNHNIMTGSFVLAHLPKQYYTYYNLNSLEINPTSDTTGMSANIRKIIRTAVNASLFSVQLKKAYHSTQGMHVRYLGNNNGYHIFLLIKPIFAGVLGSEDGFQAIIYADVESGEIVFTETTVLYSDGQMIEVSANYDVRKPRNAGNHYIYPTKIKGSISQENIKTHFLIEDNKISRTNLPPIPRKDRRNTM